ncbi:DUF6226 family protein [Micrococcus luteus]|uniref:DUF6226 family protein n=1 Tax=Micrococcus luteus TaxID=1270 RepID=UPI00200655C1|nr:DUF6226 family protein [Micrococcus luteus]MCK6110114.1 hypothetical protein [Micrococcus luteus]
MTARAGGWAEVLAEAGAAVVPDPVRGIPLDEAGRADLAVPVDRALRVAPPAGVDGALPWWLLETDVPQDDDGGVLPVIRVAVSAPGQVHAVLPDCGCDACDPGSDELLEAVDQAVVRAVGAGVSLRGRHGLRRRDWHVHWRADGTAEGQGPGWPFEALTDACRDLAAGGRPRLPRGTEATVRAGWFPEE